MLEILNKIPEDLIENAYLVNFGRAEVVKIQMEYNSKIVKKYAVEKDITTKISPNGFLEWWYKVEDALVEITMT